MCENCETEAQLNYRPVNGNYAKDTATSPYDNYRLGLAAAHYTMFLEALGFDLTDPNMTDTPMRVAKMYMHELFAGTWQEPPKITTFALPDTAKPVGDEMIISGPLTVKSMCAHHMLPITGQCWIGLFLGKSPLGLPGLSKYARVLNWFMRRPQLQEQLTLQVRDYLVEQLKIDEEYGGVIVVIKASHGCMTLRGVNEPCSDMITSALYGRFFNPATRQEFFTLCGIK